MNKLRTYLFYTLVVLMMSMAMRWAFLPFVQTANVAQAQTSAFFATQLKDATGRTYDLKQYQGKVLVINFWASWCEPCREEMPDFSSFYHEHHAKGVEMVGLAIDDLASVQTFSQELKVSYPLLIAEAEGMALSESLGNDKGVLPYTVVIGSDGQVKKAFFGRVSRQMLENAVGI